MDSPADNKPTSASHAADNKSVSPAADNKSTSSTIDKSEDSDPGAYERLKALMIHG